MKHFSPILRRLSGLLAVMILVPLAAQAAQPFNEAKFHSAQESGKTILVDVAAP